MRTWRVRSSDRSRNLRSLPDAGCDPSLQQRLVEEEAAPVARRTGAAERLDQPFGDALPRHLHEPQLRDVEHLGTGLVAGEGRPEGAHDVLAVLADLHVDEVDDDDPADVPEAKLSGDLLRRLEVVAVDGLLEVGPADVLAGVHVDDSERLGA